MAVENSNNTIKGLVDTNPLVQDPVHDAPKHFWMIKRVLKTIFPGENGGGFDTPILPKEKDINELVGLNDALNDVGVADDKDKLNLPSPKSLAVALRSFHKSIASITERLTTAEGTLNRVYPVGSIYFNIGDDKNPNELLGFGTWVRIEKGRFLVSGFPKDPSDTSFDYTPGVTGGTADSVVVRHTHTISSDGAHQHTYNMQSGTYGSGSTPLLAAASGTKSAQTASAGGHSHTATTVGKDGTNMNLPPFLAVNMWKRTA